MPILTMAGAAVAPLHFLDWDSDHFGFRVARIDGTELGDLELADLLSCARRASAKLVYWAAEPGRVVPQHLLNEFGGLLVDRKVTFRIELSTGDCESEPLPSCPITEHPQSEPGPGVARLGLAAGVCSRFGLDPRIPRGAFERLYQSWILRSVAGELADVVLIAGDLAAGELPAGLVTVSVTGLQGSIGLIAVDPRARGRKIGTSLIHAAHRWLHGRGANRVAVVTQLENQPACRLYEKCGYRRAELHDRYHFWP
jgi:dTDP-4-amino-4,6-dideoxy-D-galactose acyltransferase